MARSADHSKTGYKELKAELRRGTFRNLYVLYGEETFLIDKLCQSLREMLIAPGAEVLDAVTLSGSAAAKISPDRLLAEIQTPPFLSRCRLVMVRGSGLFAAADRAADETGEGTADSEPAEQEQRNSKGQKQEWIRILSTVPESACLVFVEGKVDRRQKALLQAVEERGVLAEIGPEQPALLRQWVVAEARQRGYTIDPLAAESLVDRCGNSMQMLWQEMCKLFLYLEYTKSQQIDRNLIDLLSLPDLKGNIFDMTDAISRGQTARALELCDLLISQKEPVQLIAFMLARHFRQLICAHDLGRADALIRDLKVMPFVASRLLQQARSMTVEQMEHIYELCFTTDLAVKTGQLPERLALEMLLVTAATAATPAAAPSRLH